MFKDSFKYYKSKQPLPSFENVLDFYNLNIISEGRVSKVNTINTNAKLRWLIPSGEWEVYSITENPGLIYIKNPFTKLGERYWNVRCLQDFTRKPNKLNIDVHNLISEEQHWWELAQNDKSVMRKLRWATLGYHHDWDSKIYSENSKNAFPVDLNELCVFIAEVLGFKDFNAEAAIVNYYHLDSTLSGHTDHSEQNLEAPLFSFSFGNTAVFLLGGTTLDDKPTAMFLKSGDVLVMSKESRLCYHGVPKIIDGNIIYDQEDPIGEYLSKSRINMNVRQVLKCGQKMIDL